MLPKFRIRKDLIKCTPCSCKTESLIIENKEGKQGDKPRVQEIETRNLVTQSQDKGLLSVDEESV